MSDALATYLHDHLAGSHFAIKLLSSLPPSMARSINNAATAYYCTNP
jgi:hypothetical protein